MYNDHSLETAGLLGKVKQMQQICYKAHKKGGEIVQGKIQLDHQFSSENYIINYNEKGLKTSDEIFAKDGRYVNTYNDKFIPIETIQYAVDGKLFRKTTSTYNEKGMHLASISRNGDGSLYYRAEDTYNKKGQLVKHMHYMGDEERVIDRTLYTYTERGDNLSIIKYNEDGSINYQNIFTYNEQGKLTERNTQYTDKKMVAYNTKDIQKYNKQGDCIEHTFYNADGSIKSKYTYTHKYDKQGKCIETTNFDENGNVYAIITHEYDAKGNKIIPPPVPYVPPVPEGQTEECEYDKHNNWIKKTIFYNKVPHNILTRHIAYYGEKKTDNTIADTLKDIKREENSEDISEFEEELSAEDTKWLAEGTHLNDPFPLFRYYALINKIPPALITYSGPYIEAFALLEELKENMGAKLVNFYKTYWDGYERLQRYTLRFSTNGYLLHAMQITATGEEEFDVPAFITKSIDHPDDGCVYTSQFQLLCPTDASGRRDEMFEEELQEYIDKCSLKKKPDLPTIYMIETSANGFEMEEHPVKDDFEIKDLDVNYGYGFEQFHNDLMQRFNTQTKGLVLFHGLPGTGKTYYIRHLLRCMASGNKVVIYMPPNMVDHLVEPAFMTFLSNEVKEWSAEGKFCVLLIEDAEPLLASRQQGVRIQGVTNLLNMSDGLLNDMLNLQIICTFNVDLKKLDSALLRPGRLIARKEFKALSELDANLLAQRLGIKHHFTKPATLSEVYALLKNKNTLIHDVEHDKGASTNIDDLL